MVRADSEQQQSPPGGWVVGGDEWEAHRPAIQELYQNQNLALKEVIRIMEESHGFRATQRMYKTRIKSWGLDKNFKESEVVELFRLRRERDRIGKPTVYAIRGREVDWDRVQTYVRRKGLDIARLIDEAPLINASSSAAREVSCRTPTPEPERLTSPASTISSSYSSSSTTTAASSPNDARTALPTSATPYLFPARRTSRPDAPPSATSPSPSPQPLTLTPERIRSMQRFLARIYDTVMFEDGDRAWGTTEYWLRNTRSQEWIMTVRVKLALYRGYFSAAAGASPRGFRTLNRAFAMLEPLSASIIGTRMFYLVNFLFSFSMPDEAARAVGGVRNPFAATVAQLVESLNAACAVPPMGGLAGDTPIDSSASGLQFSDVGEPDFRESAGMFLAKVLEQMVSVMGVTLPKEVILLLEEEEDGYPVLPDNWRGRLSRTGGSQTRAADISAGEAFETAMWLLSRREDANAEEYLVGLVDAVSALPLSSSAREPKALASEWAYALQIRKPGTNLGVSGVLEKREQMFTAWKRRASDSQRPWDGRLCGGQASVGAGEQSRAPLNPRFKSVPNSGADGRDSLPMQVAPKLTANRYMYLTVHLTNWQGRSPVACSLHSLDRKGSVPRPQHRSLKQVPGLACSFGARWLLPGAPMLWFMLYTVIECDVDAGFRVGTGSEASKSARLHIEDGVGAPLGCQCALEQAALLD
ncbi:hypothetical protein QBC34DRAFT_427047 [Podospora aff. communis PSN243]|uniref:Clr5 domain-containing protein n=1 Tax=Podospora aff. communis PSN243 TaxID=3040156 RepID=A0AAV9GIB1_9PEZI|nr:hypothetical protein QBC34DRAFT_427047 [Podospora aff. communis PSN243]